jgi:hypothetical protein
VVARRLAPRRPTLGGRLLFPCTMATMDQMEVKDEKFFSPSAEKNREPILAVLKKIIPQMRGRHI